MGTSSNNADKRIRTSLTQATESSTAVASANSLFWTVGFIAAALVVFALKIYLAYSTEGAPDISAWKDFLRNIQECGVCVYSTGGVMQEPRGARITPFNHPPFIIHYLRMVGTTSGLLGLDFGFVFRVLTSCVDLGSAVLVYRLLKRFGWFSPGRFLLYLLAPATIIISGFHGQTDTLMIFFVLLAAYLIDRPLLAGIAFGCALCIKIVPIIFAVAFILYLHPKGRIWFICAAVVSGVVLSLPFIAQEPVLIIKEVLGYGSFAGRWGWTRALADFVGPSKFFWLTARIGAYILIAYIWYLSIKMWRNRVPLLLQLGLIGFMLLAFTPAWGTNYMSWLDPFAPILGIATGLAYYSTSGALLGYLYFVIDAPTRLYGVAWLGVLFVTWMFLRQIKHSAR